jgi:hypothetical protein
VRFWDSSALVPLVVQQPASPEVELWIAEDAAVVVWTPVLQCGNCMEYLFEEPRHAPAAATPAAERPGHIYRHLRQLGRWLRACG